MVSSYLSFTGPAQGASSQYSSYQQGQGQQYGTYRTSQTGPSAQQQRPYGYEQVKYLNFCHKEFGLAFFQEALPWKNSAFSCTQEKLWSWRPRSIVILGNPMWVYWQCIIGPLQFHKPKDNHFSQSPCVHDTEMILSSNVSYFVIFNRVNMETTSNKGRSSWISFISIV